jgi:DNA helicase-2/ATP-dependent DNA helicase PcrA
MILPKEKLDIIETLDSNMVIQSCPGAGKTLLLTHYIKNLLKLNVPADRILVLMFGNKASREFSSRLNKTCPSSTVKVKTFHSYGYELYCQLSNVGYLQTPYVADNNDPQLRGWFRKELVEANKWSNNQQYQHISNAILDNFMNFYSIERNLEFSLPTIPNRDRYRVNELFMRAYSSIRGQIRSNGTIPLIELIATPCDIIKEQKDLIDNLSDRYDYILTDESQDMSLSDFKLVKLHLQNNTKLISVGDSDQCINEFRGANKNIFINIPNLLPNVVVKKLETSYRFSHHLTFLSKKVFGKQSTLPIIKSDIPFTNVTLDQELSFDSSHPIFADNDYSLADTCLILREHNAFPVYELTLLNQNKKYNLVNKLSFIHNKSIAMLLGYIFQIDQPKFKLLDFETQSVIMKNVLYTPYPQMMNEISQVLLRKMPALSYDMLSEYDANNKGFGEIPFMFTTIKRKFDENSLVSDVLLHLASFKIMDCFFNTTTAKFHQSALSQVRLLQFFTQTQMTVKRLIELVFRAQHDTYTKDNDSIKLSTVHEVKGLQFPQVIIGGLVEGIFPLIRNSGELSTAELEEEECLFFVAMTRAQKRLKILSPNSAEDRNCNIFIKKNSRFIERLQR